VQINIQVIQNVLKSATSKAGKPYKLHEIAYKNLDNGKVEEAKINQYSDLFSKVAEMQAGMSFTITKEKVNDFWTWTKVDIMTDKPTTPAAATSAAGYKSTYETPAGYKSTYETPEERARRQVLIVRQSSLTNAVAILSPGAKGALKKEDVLVLAQQLSEWVFATNPGAAFDDIPDEVGVE
jgi:hypothetical protein